MSALVLAALQASALFKKQVALAGGPIALSLDAALRRDRADRHQFIRKEVRKCSNP